jgi:hypothetical protein
LHIGPLNPLHRDTDQDAEDDFCRALVRLDATWWTSEARHSSIRKIKVTDDEVFEAAEANMSWN